MDRDAAFSLGRYVNFKWTVTQYDPLEFNIQYQGGDVDTITKIARSVSG